MQTQPSEKQFFRYVIPSMLTMLLMGFYAIIDGFFVGHAIGDTGLAAINLSWPIAAFLLAAGTGIGAGGSVVMSTRLGEGRLEESRRAYGNTFFVLIFFSIAMTVILSLFYVPILSFLGAEGELLQAAAEYTQIVAAGSACQILGTGIVPLLRNKGKTISAMIAMISGLGTNIVLDALFIMGFGWGMFGAALATVIAQAIVAAVSLIMLLSKKENRLSYKTMSPDIRTIGKLLKIGFSPFGISFAPSIVIILANWQCLAYGGGVVVAAYSVLMYFVTSVQQLLYGVGEGIQPLVSYFNGAKQQQHVDSILKRAFAMVLILSGALLCVGILCRTGIPAIFGASSETAALVSQALVISSFAFPLVGITRLASSFFYATQNTRFSAIIIYIDPLVLTPLFLFTLPLLFDVTGIWLAMPAAQLALVVIVAFLFRKYRHFHKINRLEYSYETK